jgi:cell division protein FtsW (lipid II flippase)
MNRLLDHTRLLGLVCGALAVGLGIVHLTAAGAPFHYSVVNLAALILGFAVWLVAPVIAARWSDGATLALASTLLATTFLAAEANGASRWVSAGPLSLQVSFIVLPAIIVLYARGIGAIGTACILAAAFALAAQPDRAMAGVLVAGTGAIVVTRPSRLSALAFSAALLCFAATMLRPDVVPAVPFVERVLSTSFDAHMLLGFAVIIGCLILLAPTLGAVRDGRNRPILLAFGACWAASIAASALGDYPTPLLGYGGSAVLGYFLSAALLGGSRDPARQTDAGD